MERSVHAAAARRLLPDVHTVAEALVWARGHAPAAADELWVDEDTLAARLAPGNSIALCGAPGRPLLGFEAPGALNR